MPLYSLEGEYPNSFRRGIYPQGVWLSAMLQKTKRRESIGGLTSRI